jgi:hypothetical protein
MATPQLDKSALLDKLPPIKYARPEKSESDRFDQVSLASSLLLLAELGHEQEYNLCCATAEHLLGEVPEPDDADMAEE